MTTYYRVNFTTANNVDLRQVFSLNDSNGNPVDLTGASLKMDIEHPSNNDVLDTSLDNGHIVLVNGPIGQFEIAVPATAMGELAPGVYKHDLVLTLANTHVHRVWKGTLTLHRGVTQ